MRTKSKNNKEGISLIVLVITIIVMIILASAIILSLSNNGIIGRANEAVEITDKKQIETIAQTIWADTYLEGKKTQDALKDAVIKGLTEANVKMEDYIVRVTQKGVEVLKVESVEEIQKNNTFNYYSTLKLAITDVNNNTIGANADATGETGAISVYIKSGQVNVLLLKDVTELETIDISKNITINLGGKKLTLGDNAQINFTNTVTNAVINGRLKGSSIYKKATTVSETSKILINVECLGLLEVFGGSYKIEEDTEAQTGIFAFYIRDNSTCYIEDSEMEAYTTSPYARCINMTSKAALTMYNCKLEATSENYDATPMTFRGTGIFRKCIFNASSKASWADGIYCSGGSFTATDCVFSTETVSTLCDGIYCVADAMNLTNCEVKAVSSSGLAMGIVISPYTTANITDSEIYSGAANYGANGIDNYGKTNITNCDVFADAISVHGSSGKSSVGVSNRGTLTFNSGTVFGTHSGLSNSGTLYVNGGTFKGVGQGGFYFSGTDNEAYVKNAIIDTTEYTGKFTDTFEKDWQYRAAAFYVGGSSESNNIKVYMDNCTIGASGVGVPFVLRGTDGEQNNAVYVSNSTIDTTKKIRIDNDTLKLYIGKGCNFTSANTGRPASVVTTEEEYCK